MRENLPTPRMVAYGTTFGPLDLVPPPAGTGESPWRCAIRHGVFSFYVRCSIGTEFFLSMLFDWYCAFGGKDNYILSFEKIAVQVTLLET